MTTQYSWIATNAKTGQVILDFPDLITNDSIRQTIGRYETLTVELPLPSAVAEWASVMVPGAVNLVLLASNTDVSGYTQDVPIWGASVVSDIVDHTDTAKYGLVTLEGYFDRRYVGDSPFTNVGQNDIINSLVNGYIKVGPNGGIPIRVQYVTAGAGKLRTRTEYTDQSDKTIYSILTELMAVEGGPEWYIGWEHLTAPERYTPVLYVGDRIGTATPAGSPMPNATFDMPGPVIAFERFRDYSSGKGANSVIATSSGQGTTRPQSPAQVATDPSRPTYEYRWTPSTSITDTDTLVDWAQSALGAMDGGAVTLTMSAVATEPGCPQLGTDWFLGDDIGFAIGGLDSNSRDTVPGFPGGYTGVARAIGYELTLGNTPIITPVLAGPQVF